MERAINKEQASAWFAPRTSAPRLEILTSAALRKGSAFLPVYMEAMTGAGWTVECVEVESFAGGVIGQARADKMREHLVGAYTEGVTHVLLIGNPHPQSGDLPMKLAYPLPDELTHAVPTDLYYSDLSGNWDKNGDGYAGTYGRDGGPGGVDFLPEVIVGRIPVYHGKLEQMDAYLRRLLYYKGKPQDPARRVLLPHSVPFLPNELGEGEPMTDGAELGEELSRYELTPAGIPHVKLYEKEGLSPSPYPCDYPITRENLMDLWDDEGVGAVIWYGHGSPNVVVRTIWMQDDGDERPEWEEGEVEQEIFFASEDAWGVNPRTPSFVFEVACENATPEREDNSAASLLRTGALAVSGASRWAAVYGQETDFEGHGSAPGIGYRFMKNILIQGMDAGSALGAARSDPASDFDHPYWWANVYDYNLCGDPTLTYAGGQLPAAQPEPSVYWVRTQPEGVSPCGEEVSLTVRSAGSGKTLTVPGALALGAEVGEVKDEGDGVYTVRLANARALGGQVSIAVDLDGGAGSASLYRVPSRIYDESGNVEGDAKLVDIVDIVEAGSALEAEELVLDLRLAGPLHTPSQFQGENFYAVIWSIDADGDGWEDQSAHFYQYQGDEWALYALDPDYEELEAAGFFREGDRLTIRVPADLIPAGTTALRWRVAAWVYSTRSGYTYQELEREGALCVGAEPGLEPAPVFPGGAGAGGINPTAASASFAVISVSMGWGDWDIVGAHEAAYCPLSLGDSLGVAGVPAGMTAYRQGTGPLSLAPMDTGLWAAGDDAILPVAGTLLAAGLDGYTAVIEAGGTKILVTPGRMTEIPWTEPGRVAVASGQGVALHLRTEGGDIPLHPASQGWTHGWIPGVAHIDGFGGTRWRSRLVLWNGTSDSSEVRLTFHPGGWEGEALSVTLQVPAGSVMREEDILLSRFGVEGFGLLEIESETPLQGWIATHLEGDPEGGQLIPPMREEEALGPGDAFPVPASVSSMKEKLLLANGGPEWTEFQMDGRLYGLAPGRNVWMPAPAGTPVQVLKGRLFATLSVQDAEGNPAVLHLKGAIP
jgi:hypothetical protein